MKKWLECRGKPLFLCMTIAWVCSGCASTQETSTLQQSVSMLYDRVYSLERRVQSSEGQGQRSADLYSRIEELQMKVGALNGRVEELQYRLDQVGRVQELSSPPAASGPGTLTPPPGSPPPLSSLPPPVPAPGASTKTTVPEAKVTLPESEDPEKVQFDKATQLFSQGKHESARKEYASFLSKYPKSSKAETALFNVA